MLKLKLKSDLPENFRVTKQIPGVGMVMFSSEKVKPEDYHKWHKMGFSDLFEEVEPVVEKSVEGAKELVNKRKTKA